MESINRIQRGVNTDFHENEQPEGTLRSSLNGRLNALGGGRYSWTVMKGTTLIFSPVGYGQIIGICHIREYLYYLSFVGYTRTVSLIKAKMTSDQTGLDGVQTVIANYTSDFNYNPSHPIRAMWGYYENEEIQRIYFTDFYNKPRSINVLDPEDLRFIDFTPIADTTGTFSLTDVVTGGSLFYGPYFLAYRLSRNTGYYSDWSFHSNPINVADSTRGTTHDDYHDYVGGSSSVSSGNKIQIDIDNIDTGYDKIDIVYFRANDFNSILPGVIAFRGDITGSTMSFEILGEETIGSVIIDDLILSAITIMKCKDMFPIKGYNTIYNLNERAELPLDASIADVSIDEEKYEIILDQRRGTAPSINNPIVGGGILGGATVGNILWGGWWYEATATGTYTTFATSTVVNFTLGDRFKCTDYAQLTTGSLKPIIRKKKYLKGTAVTPYSDSDYEWEEVDMLGKFGNYKDPLVSHHVKGYASNIKIRLAVLFWDLENKPYFARHIGDFIPSGRDSFGLTTLYGDAGTTDGQDWNQTNGNVISLMISGIDITDYKDQISGFSIVRCVIPEVKLATGVLLPVNYYASPNDAEHLAVASSYGNYGGYSRRREKTYCLYSPEVQFDSAGKISETKIQNSIYLGPLAKSYTTLVGIGNGVQDTSGRTAGTATKVHQKMYIPLAGPGSGNGAIDNQNEVLETTTIEPLAGNTLFDSQNPSFVLVDAAFSLADTIHTKISVLVTDNNESSGTDPNNKPVVLSSDPQLLLVDLYNGTAEYGSSDASSLETNQYITTGHYQQVDAAFLADIKNSSNQYIINGVQVFGGDHYVCLYDTNAAIMDEDAVSPTSWSFIIPVETKLNLDLRQGRKFAQLQSYDPTHVLDGIGYDSSTPWINFEQYILNRAYSTDRIGDFYPGLPYNQSLQPIHDVMTRYSSHKTNGEQEDSFKVFLINNYRELDPRYGAITGAKANGNYTVIWQPDAISYIPITERQLQSGEFGQAVQLGVGGIFDIDDQVSTMLGSSHQFGIIETPEKFLFFDAKRKFVIAMSRSMKIDINSILTGYREEIEALYDPNMISSDNPRHFEGIVGGYEPGSKSSFLTFRQSGADFTLGFDDIEGLYMGQYSIHPRLYYYNNDVMLSLIDFDVHAHNRGGYGSFYQDQKGAEVSVIVRDKSALAMKWDNIVATDLGDNFTSIEYESYIGSVEDIIANDAGELTTRLYKRIRNELRGSVARITKQRIDGAWLKITFKLSDTWSANKQVGLYQLLTKYRHGW